MTFEPCETVTGDKAVTGRRERVLVKCGNPSTCEIGEPFQAYLCADCCRRMMERGEVTRWRDMPPGKRWHKEKP